MKLKEYSLLVCILFVVSLSSCSDNPVDPGNNNSFIFLDTTRFEWTVIEFKFGVLHRPDVHVFNQNEQIVIDTDCFGNNWAYYYVLNNSHERVDIFPDNALAVNTIPGKGTFMVTCTRDEPRVIKYWKWNDNKFNQYLQPDIDLNISENVCSFSFIDRENNMWVTTRKGKALKFDGDSVKVYDLRKDMPQNRATSATYFTYNGSDNLKAFGVYTYTEHGYDEYSWCIYRFENDEWVLEHEELIQWTLHDTFTAYSKIGDRVIRYQKNVLQLYDNAGGFTTHWDLSGTDLEIEPTTTGIRGKDLNNFMLPLDRPNYIYRYYYYDGNTFSPELGYSHAAPFSKVEFFNDMIFHVIGDYPVTKFNIGRKK